MIDLEQEHDIVDLTPYRGGRKVLFASREGRGFVVAEDDLVANTRKGKGVMGVDTPDELAAVRFVEGDHVAIVGLNRKLLVFPLNQVPEMARGKGVRLQKYKEGGMVDLKTFTLADGLTWKDSSDRTWTVSQADLTEWVGNRADSGRLPPKGFPRPTVSVEWSRPAGRGGGIRMLVRSLTTAAMALVLGAGASWAQAPGSSTLARIKERGHIMCGASQGVPGFSQPDNAGVWRGFDTDMCRALAAAIFDDPDKARYLPLASKDRLIALQGGNIDVLSRTTTWSIGRELGQGLAFTAINYYDGQGFLVRKSANLKSARDLAGATICVSQGTTNELNLADYFRTQGLTYQVVTFGSLDEVAKAYDNGRCDAYTTDMSQLATNRLLLKNPDEHMILPEIISKEPIGPGCARAIRNGSTSSAGRSSS